MKCEIEEFIDYLHNTRGTSKNTEVSYERDLRKLETYLTEGGFETEEQVTSTVLNSYVLYMDGKILRLLLFPGALRLSVLFFSI